MVNIRGFRSRDLVWLVLGLCSLGGTEVRANYLDLLVTNLGNGSVADLNRVTGAANPLFVPTGTTLLSPRGIAIGPDTNVYVGEISGTPETIKVYSGTGTLLNTVNLPAGNFQPQAFAFSPTNGLLYLDSGTATVTAAGTGAAVVYTFNTTTTALTPFALSGIPTAGLNTNFTAIGLTFDATGNLYLASATNNAVYEFNASGAYIRTFAVPVVNPANPPLPSGIAINNLTGTLYVASGSTAAPNGNFPSITEFNINTGALVGSITNAGLNGVGAGGLLYDPATNRLYVGGDFSPNVFAFNATTGVLDPTFGSGGLAPIAGVLPFPYYLALAPVPEPSSVALLGLGIAGVVATTVRKNRRASA